MNTGKKQSIIILAHKNFNQLSHLISYFDRDCDVFVHVDKKAKFTEKQFKDLLSFEQTVRVYSKFSVHWAGFSILKTELFMLKEALKYSDAKYFHLISAQDYPIKLLTDFLSFFGEGNDKNYLEYHHIPFRGWEDNTYSRYRYFFLFDWLPRSDKAKRRNLHFINFQKKIGIRRAIPTHFDHLYGGSAWFSITRDAVTTLLKYTNKNKGFYRRLKYTFCPEETYITTVLVNLMPPEKIVNNNYRLIRWQNENGSFPANYGLEHFYMLATHSAFFARKFDTPVSDELITVIDKYLVNDSSLEIMSNGGWNYDGYIKYSYSIKIMDALYKYVKMLGFTEVLDMGCGVGYYVTAFRRLGILATGYDANPHIRKLSTLLVNDGKNPCDIADLTDNLDIEGKFEVVLCLDVLPYIPITMWSHAIRNLIAMTKNTLIVSYLAGKTMDIQIERGMKQLIKEMEEAGFANNTSVNKIVFSRLSPYNFMIFENKNNY